MSVLKAPPKQPKNVTLQVRIDEDLKYRVDKYAEFLGTTEAYVVSGALRLVFNKDVEFREWLEKQEDTAAKAQTEPLLVATTGETHPSALGPSSPQANGGNGLFR
jgi:hypothetical protein